MQVLSPARPFVAALVFLLAVPDRTAHAQPTTMSTTDQAAIEATLLAYGSALNASDADAAVAAYTSDGVFMPTNAPTASGTDALLASYRYIFSQIRLDVAFEIQEIGVDGNQAFAVTSSQGQQTVLATNTTGPEANRELFVLRREGDAWKIARYMFNKAD